MIQKTFMMIKPDGFKHKDEIFKILEENGLNIKYFKEVKTDMRIMKNLLEHYQEVIDEKGKDFNFVGKLFNSFYFGAFSIIPMIVTYDGDEDIIRKSRDLVGATNPQDAQEGTLRNRFSDDSYAKADVDNRLVNNVIHASDSIESVIREIAIWESVFK